jgi:actin-related protein
MTISYSNYHDKFRPANPTHESASTVTTPEPPKPEENTEPPVAEANPASQVFTTPPAAAPVNSHDAADAKVKADAEAREKEKLAPFAEFMPQVKQFGENDQRDLSKAENDPQSGQYSEFSKAENAAIKLVTENKGINKGVLIGTGVGLAIGAVLTGGIALGAIGGGLAAAAAAGGAFAAAEAAGSAIAITQLVQGTKRDKTMVKESFLKLDVAFQNNIQSALQKVKSGSATDADKERLYRLINDYNRMKPEIDHYAYEQGEKPQPSVGVGRGGKWLENPFNGQYKGFSDEENDQITNANQKVVDKFEADKKKDLEQAIKERNDLVKTISEKHGLAIDGTEYAKQYKADIKGWVEPVTVM